MLRKNLVAALAAPALALFISTTSAAQAVDTAAPEKKTTITGSVDVYYRYNFLNAKDLGVFNNLTSFTNSQNSFELGMASVKIEHSFGKVSGVLDLGVGKRAEEFSYNDRVYSEDENGDIVSSPTLLAAIKQAYVTFAPSDKFKFTFGKFGTHVGYELLDPQLNRNYSMSYMFSYGPFFHTGLKLDVTPTDNISFMVGISNPTDFSTASFEKKYFLGQFHAASSDGKISGYLNYVGGKNLAEISTNQFDLVLTGKVTDKFGLGYNGTYRTLKYEGFDKQSFWGSALYVNYDATDKFGLTLRGELFDDKKNGTDGLIGTSVFAATLSGNIKVGPLTIIPEFRLDSAKDPVFVKNSGEATKSSASAILAAVLSF
jgi:hypothetical protein